MSAPDNDKTRPLPVDGPILRAIRLIRLLTEIDGEISVKEAAQRLDLPVSTTHRLLHVLGHEGLAEKSPRSQRYRVGVDLQRMGRLIASQTGWNDLARPYLQDLVDKTREASLFVAYLPATQQVSVMAVINSPHPLRYEMREYASHSVAWGATGRSILAFLPETEQRKVWERSDPSPATGEKLPAWSEFKTTLDGIRTKGYAISRGQKISGAIGMGAPVRHADGRLAGSLCLSMPEMRFDADAEQELSRLLLHQAQRFSAMLGRDD